MVKILLVDDDKALSDELIAWLTKPDQHTVDQALDGVAAELFLESYSYALIILDWELPDTSGVDILRKFRNAGGKTPVLMLTGRNATSDKLKGLDTGSDDYLTKPFNPEELSARVRALLRRAYPDNADDATSLRFGKVLMDCHTRRVEFDSQLIKFQPSEFDLLYFLATHPNQIFDADRLIKMAWPENERASEGSLRVCLSRIRKKIQDSDELPFIENLAGAGYRFNPRA